MLVKVLARLCVCLMIWSGLASLAQPLSAITPIIFAQQPRDIAFVNVNVVPMDRERVLLDQTVIIKDGRIAEIGPSAKVKVPKEALTVDGKSKLYLMPGLADMHTHLRYESDLALYVASGVTTVRNMRGTPRHLEWRGKVEKGELLGPRIYTTGPILSGPRSGFQEINTKEEAIKAVTEQKKAGYDAIKVYDQLPREAYDGVIAAAKQEGLPVFGHAPSAVGIEGVLKAGQASIEHAEQYVYHFYGDEYNDFEAKKIPEIEKKVPEIAKATREAGTWVCPTLGTIENFILQVDDLEKLLARPELKYTHPETLAWWRTQQKDSSEINKVIDRFQASLVRAFRDAGVRMLAGTDMYAIGFVPGFSLHRELQSLVKAGLTPYQALETATRNPGELMKGNFGTVSVGQAADLILVDGNPLKDVSNVAQLKGVMVRGRWLPETELHQMLGKIETSFAKGQQFISLILARDMKAVTQLFHEVQKNGGEIFQAQRYVFDSLGHKLLREKSVREAIELFKLNIEANPQSASVHNSLAEALLAQGNKEAAIKCYEKSLELNPNDAAVKAKLDKLRQ